MLPKSLPEFQSLDVFFPKVIAISFIAIDECDGKLYAEELESIRRAVPKRKREFLAGREMARSSLAKLGFGAVAIPVGLHREPIWPSKSIGSITHDDNFCIAVAALKKEIALIGIDLTTQAGMDGDLVDLVCTAAEIEQVRTVDSSMETDPYKLIFSIKESVYKCLYPAVRKIFDFQSVSICLNPESESAKVSLIDQSLFADLEADLEINAKYCSFGNYIFSAAWIEQRELESNT